MNSEGDFDLKFSMHIIVSITVMTTERLMTSLKKLRRPKKRKITQKCI